ncbi:unnamed protein product [Blepharisma stoltei]|uniref:Uncharacterized protein n=1 Tax=Blepharisma stoltei TaxID=1481888 RepID=A0AAU9ISW3_9CILI|nr:unnamed protein product [Blepharisma stoltei]
MLLEREKRQTVAERRAEEMVLGINEAWKYMTSIKKRSNRAISFQPEDKRSVIEWWRKMYNGPEIGELMLAESSNNNTITREEILKEISWIKNGKANGPDGISGELIKYGSDELKRENCRSFDEDVGRWGNTKTYEVSKCDFTAKKRRRC